MAGVKEQIADLEKRLGLAVQRGETLQKRLSDVEVAHRVVEEELRRKAEEAGPAAVQAFKGSEEFKAEVEQKILGRREEIALGWFQTHEGEAKLDDEGALCFQLGQYGMQKSFYDLLAKKDSSFSAQAWGLPVLMTDPEAPVEAPVADPLPLKFLLRNLFQVELEGCYYQPLFQGVSEKKTWFVLLPFLFENNMNNAHGYYFLNIHFGGFVYPCLPSVA
ncbi:unnamed protein product [Cuscuta europaea]|uniref:Uncharacterized protein n=1 Tax=Cuscuta europaea TaxID=41803 RepID=A0A9P0YQM3_CUSEU|nr:unnamed protein product [Cuscuta europaea]